MHIFFCFDLLIILLKRRHGGQTGATSPPPTGAKASLEIDANPMSFLNGGRGLKQMTDM